MRRRTLRELNVMDDFLFNEMLMWGEKGEEFCRILLRTILGQNIRDVKVVAQRKVQGINTNQHGIVLDAYIEAIPAAEGENMADVEVQSEIFDIEPNKYEKDSEAKRTRYYHALIDSKILKSGVNYKDMKNVTIIMILPYDPFGKGRMIYTIQNRCEEEPEIDYDDGVRTIYLNAAGAQENGSQELCDMLKYIQKSTEENATNEDLKYIHSLAKEVKDNEEVGVSYMKSWEREYYFRREGKKEGEISKLVDLVCKKILKDYSVAEIADMLEEEETVIQEIYDVAVQYAPEYDVEKIVEVIQNRKEMVK